MTLKETIDNAVKRLTPEYGKGEAQAMLRIIIGYLKGYSPVDIVLNGDKETSDYINNKVDDIVARLLRHEPLQYILGQVDWHGMVLKVTPAVLIPRQETSELVDIITDVEGSREDLRVLDLCTGSGCIAIALARNLKFSQVTGVDISEDALAVANENAATLKTKVKFEQEDITKPHEFGPMDIVVSNPPYVLESEKATMSKNVLDYEPEIALFVPDDDPLEYYKAVERIASHCLVAGGRLYLEINPLTAENLSKYLGEKEWQEVSVLPDVHGRKRFISARKMS
ncbi:MAG: peptide chain release factor N(5)-glutamine methyltransferase [Lachnoclostridium sp.]|nr:peptide chain release factor N(5)-glutamine methyltransferase [Lachnoclostridium sp.]